MPSVIALESFLCAQSYLPSLPRWLVLRDASIRLLFTCFIQLRSRQPCSFSSATTRSEILFATSESRSATRKKSPNRPRLDRQLLATRGHSRAARREIAGIGWLSEAKQGFDMSGKRIGCGNKADGAIQVMMHCQTVAKQRIVPDAGSYVIKHA